MMIPIKRIPCDKCNRPMAWRLEGIDSSDNVVHGWEFCDKCYKKVRDLLNKFNPNEDV
jgi:hypothetical protein